MVMVALVPDIHIILIIDIQRITCDFFNMSFLSPLSHYGPTSYFSLYLLS